MGAFKYCGSNHFKHYAWSPTGELLFFDLPLSANLMNAGAKNKPLYRLPIELPTGQTVWINQNRIAYPLAADPNTASTEHRIGLFDTLAHTMDAKVPSSDIMNFMLGKHRQSFIFPPQIQRAFENLPNGPRYITVKPAFDWQTEGVDSFRSPQNQML